MIDIDFSLSAEHVVRALDRFIEWRGERAFLSSLAAAARRLRQKA